MSDGYCGACKKYSYVERYGREGWQFGYCQTTTCIRTWERKKRRHAGKHRKMRRTAPQGTCLEIRLVLVRAIGRSSNSGRQQVSETMTSTQSIIGRKTGGLHVLGMDGLIQWNQGHQWSGLNGINGINGVRLTATAVVGVSRVQEQVGRR